MNIKTPTDLNQIHEKKLLINNEIPIIFAYSDHLDKPTNFAKSLRTSGNTSKTKGNANNHDINHACNHKDKNPSTKPLFSSRL